MNKKNFISSFPAGTTRNWRDWRWQMQNRITSADTLAHILGEPANRYDYLRPVIKTYPMAVTPYYLSLIDPDNETDPLALQCLPDKREIAVFPDYSDDPLNEDSFMPSPKLLHRYPDRVLAMITSTCAMYCRHCNRKRFWKIKDPASGKNHIEKMVRYIQNSPQIREVIFSGGDPLTYDDNTLENILALFAAIPHVEVLRIGTRMPVTLPMRITKALCRILRRYRPLWINTQFNHPAEITDEAARACNRIAEAGIPVSNQSVLLKGVNDSPEIMRRLLYGLQKISVRPYYLFHCEPVRGCAHFRTELQSGLPMMSELRRNCSGLAVPQYVADLPGTAGKVPLGALDPSIKNDLAKNQDFFDNSKQLD